MSFGYSTLHKFATLTLLSVLPAVAADEFLTEIYDSLHDSPMQRKFRQIAPMPFGVVFLPWPGMTEAQMRGHFRLMKQLGFHNLKQVMGTPEWPMEKVLQVALDEDVIPFWYGEGGWEPITPELLAKLGMAKDTPVRQARKDPRMIAYQREVLRKGVDENAGKATLEGQGFHHTPDPFLRDADVPYFRKWLRESYASPAEIAKAWNEFEVGISNNPIRTWDDVDRAVAKLATQPNNLRGYGGEYGRVRDVLRYKADYHARDIAAAMDATRSGNPYAPTRTGGEMGLFLPFAWRATKMESLADTQTTRGSFYPSIHLAWHYGEVKYEVARTVYMQASFANDLFKGGWAATWESTGGPQQLTGGKGWDYPEQSTTAGFTVNEGTITQLFLSYLAAGLKGVGVWAWNYRRAGWEGGEFALLDRQLEPSARAIRAGRIAQAADKYRDEIWQAHKEPLVGVLLNWDSDAIWAATSVRGRDHFKHYPMQSRVGVERALINGNIPWEHVTVRDLEKGLAARYKVIYLPAQIALTERLLDLLTKYAEDGGRVVLDSPGGMYDEHGLVLNSAKFGKLFGANIADFQYSNNVPRSLAGVKLSGFISELKPGSAAVKAKFQTSEPAVTENRIGKGTAVLLGWDASHALFEPGHSELETQLVQHTLGAMSSPYRCDGAVVYRIASPAADHYFFINDDAAKAVRLDTGSHRYRSVIDPVSGEKLAMGSAIQLEPYSGRWLRFEK